MSMVCGSLKDAWCSSDTVEEKWKVVKTALCESAGHVLGYAWRKQPDWFRDSETVIEAATFRGGVDVCYREVEEWEGCRRIWNSP